MSGGSRRFGDGGGQPRLGDRRDGVAGYAVASQLAGEDAGKPDHAGLGGGEVGLTEAAEETPGRREVDDAAVALASHREAAGWQVQ